MLASVDAPADYPAPGQHIRWRYQLGPVQLVLHERPQEIVALERYCTSLTVGSLRLQQTYTLQREKADTPQTRLGMKVVSSNSVPVMGGEVDRFELRRMTSERIDTTLRLLQKWCENPH
jgi:hypothetical protein